MTPQKLLICSTLLYMPSALFSTIDCYQENVQNKSTELAIHTELLVILEWLNIITVILINPNIIVFLYAK